MFYIVRTLLGLVAPVLTYTADEALEHAPTVLKNGCDDLFDFGYMPIPDVTSTLDGAYFKEVREAFSVVVDEMKKEKLIKNTLELALLSDSEKVLALNAVETQDWFVVSEVKEIGAGEMLRSFRVGDDHFGIVMSTLHKCPRCWKFAAAAEETLCPRCEEVIHG
jgi:isoleucyl-tRNA synthetase